MSQEGETSLLTASTTQTPHLSEFCPRYHHAMELIGRRWTGAILRVLINGPHRFNELLHTIPGLSDRLLSERLGELETEGLVIRQVLPGPPVRVEYSLSERGYDLEQVIRAIATWAEKWLPQPEEP
jgi:DNA-binding HxlR family transcriptional regulator